MFTRILYRVALNFCTYYQSKMDEIRKHILFEDYVSLSSQNLVGLSIDSLKKLTSLNPNPLSESLWSYSFGYKGNFFIARELSVSVIFNEKGIITHQFNSY